MKDERRLDEVFVFFAKGTATKGTHKKSDFLKCIPREEPHLHLIFTSDDAKEGISAFVEKRGAQFKGS